MKPEHQVEESLIRVAYGDAGILERLRVRKLVRNDPEALKLLEEHMRVAEATRSLRRQMHSSNRVVQRVHDLRGWRETRERSFSWAAIGGVAAMACVAVVTVFVMNDRTAYVKTPPVAEYNEFGLTQEEMERARVEAEACLALFATALSGAGSLSQTIAEDAVAPRISESLERAQSFIF